MFKRYFYRNYFKWICVFTLCFSFANISLATTYYAVTNNGNWTTSGTWSTICGGLPNAVGYPGSAVGDIAIICTGITVKMNATPANSLTTLAIQGTGILNYNTNNVTLSTTGDVTLDGTASITGNNASRALNVGGNLMIPLTATGVIINGESITVSLTTQVNGAIDWANSTGTKTLGSDVTVFGTGTWSSSGNVSFSMGGNFTNSNVFSSGTGTYTFTGASNSINGTIIFSLDISVSGSYTNNGTVSVTRDLLGAGSWIQAVNSSLNLGRFMSITTLNASASGNIINYDGTYTGTAPVVYATTYYHLYISNSAGSNPKLGGNITVNGNLIITDETLNSDNGTAYTCTVNGSTQILGVGVLNFNTAGSTFNIQDLVLDGTSQITGGATGNINVSTTLTVNNTATNVTIGRCNLTVNGTTNVNGVLSFNSNTGIKTFSGAVTVNANPGSWTSTSLTTTGNLIFQNGLISNGSLFSAGGATFSANPQNISGSTYISFANIVTVTGITVTNNTTVSITSTAAGTLTGSGTWAQAASVNSILNYAGSTITSLTLNASGTGNTVNYDRNGNQTIFVPSSTYYNLTASIAGTKTLGGNVSVAQLLSISAAIVDDGTNVLSGTGGLTMDATAQLNLGDISGGSLPKLSGTYTLVSGSTIDFYGTNAQTASASATVGYQNVLISGGNNASSVNMSAVSNILGNLLFTSKGQMNSNATLTISGNLSYNGSRTTTLANNVTVNGSSGSTFSAGTFDFNGKTFTTYSLLLSGGTIQSTVAVFTIYISTGDWTYNSGTFTPSSGTVIFNSTTGMQNINGTHVTQTFNNITVDKTGQTLTVGGSTTTLTLNGTMLLTAGTFDIGTAATINVAGDWTNNGGTFTPGAGTVIFNSTTATQNINGIAATQTFNNITMNKVGQTLTAGSSTTTLTLNGTMLLTAGTFDIGTSATINVAGDWTNNGGTFTPGTGTVIFNSTTATQNINGTAATQTFNNITMNKVGQTLTAGGSTTTLTLNGTMLLTGGTFDIGIAATINVAGDWTNNGGTFTPGAGTVVFNSTTATQNINGTAATQTFNNIRMNKVGQTLTVGGSTTTLTLNGTMLLTGGTFDIGTATTINVAGDWTNNATFTQGLGTIIFNGTGTQNIGGSNSSTFYNLTFNNDPATAGDVTLNTNNYIVSNNITMLQGNVNLNGRTITLGTAAATPGTLAYTAGMLYGGTFSRWFNTTSFAIANVAGLFPMGNLVGDYRPFWIAYSLNLSSGGTVSVVHNSIANASPAAFTDASWTPPVAGTAIQAVSNSNWVVSSANGFAFNGSTGIIRFGGQDFGPYALTDLDATLIASAIDTYSPATNVNTPLEVNRISIPTADLGNTWYIGTKNKVASPLPVELLSFDAKQNENTVNVTWSTASEFNSDYFVVQRSQDGITFEDILKKDAAGNSTILKNYFTVDYEPYSGVSYYRLKQVDNNGQFTLSNSEVVNFKNQELFSVYPNPTSGRFTISISGRMGQEVLIVVRDLLSNEYYSKIIILSNENELIAFDPSGKLASGIYLVAATSENNILEKKIVIK